MKRDVVDVWVRMFRERESAFLAATRPLTPMRRVRPAHRPAGSWRRLEAADLRRRFGDSRGDLAAAIRLLQRHNRRMVERFGVNWVDATNVVLGYATERGMAVSTVARRLVIALSTSNGGAA